MDPLKLSLKAVFFTSFCTFCLILLYLPHVLYAEEASFTSGDSLADYYEDDPLNQDYYEDDFISDVDDGADGSSDIGDQFPVFLSEEEAEAEETTAVLEEAGINDGTADLSGSVETNLINEWPLGPSIVSGSAVIMEDTTGTILYAKNQYASMDPGATAKMLTVLLALENAGMDDNVTITETGANGVTDSGLHISSQLGEIYTMEQCLYAIVLASANEISLQVAEYVGGSVDHFVQMMNTRASELGCTNSHFTNPTGLEDPGQYSCAHDMALIMKALLTNDSYLAMASKTTYTIPATNLSGGDRVLTNSFGMFFPDNSAYYEGCIGGKQGFTETSGTTLLCAAKKKDITLICAILQGTANDTDQDARSLLDYGFGRFTLIDLSNDEFDILSGGQVVLPEGRTRLAVSQEDVPQGDTLLRTYLFNGYPVGSAVAQPAEQGGDEMIRQGEENMDAARIYSEERSTLPYFLIGGAAVIAIGLLIYLYLRKDKGTDVPSEE